MLSDFLYVSGTLPENRIKHSIQHVFGATSGEVETFVGPWGAVVAANRPFKGFAPIETETHICIVLGSPLWRSERPALPGEGASERTEHTRRILERYLYGEPVDWSEELVGQFAVLIIDKTAGSAVTVTDPVGFVPLYYSGSKNGSAVTIVGSHVDVVAEACGRAEDLDAVSIADFLTHGVATHPYTRYHGVKQLPAAAVSRFGSGESEPQVECYWQPEEEALYKSLPEAAEALRATLLHNMRIMRAQAEHLGYFLSGGEDSRLVGTLIGSWNPQAAYTIATEDTNELEIARRVAVEQKIQHRVAQHKAADGISMLPLVLPLTSSHNHYTHATAPYHADQLGLRSVGLVFGGFMADTFCKGDHINKTRLSYATVRLNREEHRYYRHAPESLWNDEISAELQYRHNRHIQQLRRIRPNSWAEWFSLWPSANNICNGALIANRRSVTTAEPFCDSAVVKICAGVPQTWTINRRLFHKAFEPELRQTKSIPHGAGFYPHLSTVANVALGIPKAVTRRIGGRSQKEADQWELVLNHAVSAGVLQATSRALERVSDLVPVHSSTGLLQDRSVHAWLKLGVLQIVYQHTSLLDDVLSDAADRDAQQEYQRSS